MRMMKLFHSLRIRLFSGHALYQDLWDMKVVDPELMLNDQPKRKRNSIRVKAAPCLGPLFRHVTRHENSVKRTVPEASISYGLPPAGPDGQEDWNKQGKAV